MSQWTSPDPNSYSIDDPVSLKSYVYDGNSPDANVDYSGNDSQNTGSCTLCIDEGSGGVGPAVVGAVVGFFAFFGRLFGDIFHGIFRGGHHTSTNLSASGGSTFEARANHDNLKQIGTFLFTAQFVAFLFIPGLDLIDLAEVAAVSDVIAEAGATQIIREGIYEYTDLKTGLTYVGQSGNIARRLLQHVRAGRLDPDALEYARRVQVLGARPREKFRSSCG